MGEIACDIVTNCPKIGVILKINDSSLVLVHERVGFHVLNLALPGKNKKREKGAEISFDGKK